MTTGPQLELTGGGVLVAVGLIVGGLLAFKAYKASAGILSSAAGALGQAYDQSAANVQSAWANTVTGPFQRGQDFMNGVEPVTSSKAWLYSDYGYTGQDASGQVVTDGEWYGNADARRYDAAQPPAARPAATSNNGAAFGIYRKP